MNRRALILSASSVAVLHSSLTHAAFFSDDSGACDGSTQLDRVLCRQDLFINSAPTYVTAGMLIGAALGVGLAVAARFHPGAAVVASLGGALLGGGVAGADLYIKYKLDEANGNMSLARDNIRRDINHDYQFSTVAVADSKIVLEAGKEAVKNNDHELLTNAKTLGKTRLADRKLSIVGRQIGAGIRTYKGVLPRVDMNIEPAPQKDIKNTTANLMSQEEIHSMYRIQVMEDG